MISISNQIRYQRNRLRKNKREQSILLSLKIVEKHFAENQPGDYIIVPIDTETYKLFVKFQN